MSLTPHTALRDLMLGELFDMGGKGARADVLAAIDATYGAFWTPEDLSAPQSRPSDTKWKNRCSWERVRLIEDGLLVQRDDGIWELTAAGIVAAGSVVAASPSAWRALEIERREYLWKALGGGGGAVETTADVIRTTGLYSGARGIYVDKQATASVWSPEGAAVTFLHLGSRYADQLGSDGVIYHYPTTETHGRDAAEAAATRTAYEAGLPVFVVTRGGGNDASRKVNRAYVEDVDDLGRVALITFATDELPPPPPPSQTGKKFSLTSEDEEVVWALRRARPNQSRFAFLVAGRYGTACAVCGLAVSDALEAAHLRPKSARGSDDPRNGIVLCRNHHRMFDRYLFGIHPATLELATPTTAVTLASLQITRTDLKHLVAFPHPEALEDAWQSWSKRAAHK